MGKQSKNKKSVVEVETLALREVIDILAHYDLEHCRFPHNYLADTGLGIPELRGLVVDDKKLILISNELGFEEARETIVHELLHCKHFLRGDLPHNIKRIEKVVEQETIATYYELYGNKPQ
ncbi:MAG: hypothetical protein ABII97_00595 [Patescibacteria group bacterium]